MRYRLVALLIAVFALAPASAQAALTAGGPWVPNISGLAVVNDSTWLASGGLELSRTTDAGRSWTTAVGYDSKAPNGPSQVTGVAASGGIAFAVGAWRNPDPVGSRSGALSFGVSTDAGASWTWSKMDRPLLLPRLLADPTNANRLVLNGSKVMGGTSVSTAQPVSLYSEDRGATWREGTAISAWSAAVGGDGTLYDFNSPPYSRSTDWGLSWQPIVFQDSSAVPIMTFGAPVPLGASGLVVGATSSGPDGSSLDLAFSSDRGSSWTKVATGIIGPSNSTGSSTIAVVPAPDGNAALWVDGRVAIFRPDGTAVAQFSDDRPFAPTGQAWVTGAGSVIPTQAGVIVLTTGGAENRSTGIASYAAVGGLSVSPTNPNLMLASTESGAYRSADGGSTWSYAGNVSGTIFSPRSSNAAGAQIYPETVELPGGGTRSGSATRLVFSSDGGATWVAGAKLPGLLAEQAGRRGIVWAGESRVYGIAYDSAGTSCELVRADDRLSVLTTLALPIPGACNAQVAASQDDPNLVFVVASSSEIGVLTRSQIYRSADGGATWTQVRVPPAAARRGGFGSIAVGPGAKPPLVLWGGTTTCSSTNLGGSFACSSVPNPINLSDGTSLFAGLRTLEYQVDGAVIASIGQSANLTMTLIQGSMLLRSFDNGSTWATTGGTPDFVPLAAVDITGGKAARQGGKRKKSPAGKRRLAISSVGVTRKTTTFALSATPGVRTAGIRVSRAGGGRVTVPLTCKAKHRCSGVISGQIRIGGKNISLMQTRYSILGSRNVNVAIAKRSQRVLAQARGTGTIRLQVRYTDPSGKKRNPSLTANGTVTVR